MLPYAVVQHCFSEAIIHIYLFPHSRAHFSIFCPPDCKFPSTMWIDLGQQDGHFLTVSSNIRDTIPWGALRKDSAAAGSHDGGLILCNVRPNSSSPLTFSSGWAVKEWIDFSQRRLRPAQSDSIHLAACLCTPSVMCCHVTVYKGILKVEAAVVARTAVTPSLPIRTSAWFNLL